MMNLDDLNELPEWDNEEDNEGEGWKPDPTRELCKAAYQQWNTVLFVLRTALDSMQEATGEQLFSQEHIDQQKAMILSDAYEVAAKLRSSEAAGLYVLRMENAAIIRRNAQFVKISTNNFILEELISREYNRVLRDEIDKFRVLFKQWIATFEKDQYEDEWGLFV